MPVEHIRSLPVLGQARRLKSNYTSDQCDQLEAFTDQVHEAFDAVRLEYSAEEEAPS